MKSKCVAQTSCTDKKCFLWSIISLIFPQINPIYYDFCATFFDLTDLQFPANIHMIEKFAKKNKLSISIFGFNAEFGKPHIFPILVSNKPGKYCQLNLLLLDNDHYCAILQFYRLYSLQYKNRRNVSYFCQFCLHGFVSEHNRNVHTQDCMIFGNQRTIFPSETQVKFKNVQNRMRSHFVCYADFESILEPTTEGNTIESHKVCSFAYKIVSDLPGLTFAPRLYIGVNAGLRFLDNLTSDYYDYIYPIIQKEYPIDWTTAAQRNFFSSTHCGLCGEILLWGIEEIHRDHAHFKEFNNFRMALHGTCNRAIGIHKARHKLICIFHFDMTGTS